MKDSPVTGEQFAMRVIIMILFPLALIGFFVMREYTTEMVTVTEQITMAPGDRLPITLDKVFYTGPQDGEGKVVAFRTVDGTTSRRVVNVTLPFEKGEPLPFDVATGEVIVFKAYSKGNLTVSYTYSKRMSRHQTKQSTLPN